MNNRRVFLRRASIMGVGLAVLPTNLVPANSFARGKKDSTSLESKDFSYKNDLRANPLDASITITGKVFDHYRKSGLSNAVVEICHCDARGNFKRFGKYTYKGRAKTNDNGIYQIRTNVPGKYSEDGISKSKRIFVKVSAPGYGEQFSTLYLDHDNYPFIDSEHYQNSRMFEINDLPEKVGRGNNSTIQYNLYLV